MCRSHAGQVELMSAGVEHCYFLRREETFCRDDDAVDDGTFGGFPKDVLSAGLGVMAKAVWRELESPGLAGDALSWTASDFAFLPFQMAF